MVGYVSAELQTDGLLGKKGDVIKGHEFHFSTEDAEDGNTEVFYFKNATATFSSFTHEPEVVKF